jgi:GNAT superfamily N-acetyltransferase
VTQVRALEDRDFAWKRASLEAAWNGTRVARKGELVDAADLDGFVALSGGDRIGLLTYSVRGDALEVVTLHADPQGHGAGRALMDAVRGQAIALGATRMWLITTNDNARAYRFYQRWGMDLVALYHDGATRSRALKPTIPLMSADGIPIRHELEFELLL